MEQWADSKLGREYIKAVYCHPAYLTYMQSESESRSVVSDSLRPHRLYSPWNSLARVLEWVAFPFSRGSSQFSSVSQSCLTLCDPMDCSTLNLPVHRQLLEFTQTHVLWVSDAIQPSHPLSSPSPAFSLYQHQDLFKWVSSLHQVAKVSSLHQAWLGLEDPLLRQRAHIAVSRRPHLLTMGFSPESGSSVLMNISLQLAPPEQVIQESKVEIAKSPVTKPQ